MNFSRKLNLSNQIVILDGLTGTGKTMFAPIINSFDRFQNSRFEYMIEYLCIAADKGKIEVDAASSILKLLSDIKYYDGSISREVNFRPNDLSSVFSGPKWGRYIKQLFMADGEKAGIRLKRENPILFFVTHQILSCIEPAFSAFGERLKVIQMVRHPLYLVDHWESYIMMHGNNPRDFTLWFDYEGHSIPWFAEGWEDRYINSTSFDRAVFSIEILMKNIFMYFKNNKKYESVMFIPFEKFVLNPDNYIRDLEIFLCTSSNSMTKKILKRQYVPRFKINAGPQKNIYKRYAQIKNGKEISDQDEYYQKLDKIKDKCSVEAFEVLLSMNKEYENYFGLWF